MVKHACWLTVALLLIAPAFAGNEKPATPPPPKADPALLEFLGSWQASDGQWVDPMTFARIDPAKLAAEHARREGKPLPSAKDSNLDKTPPDDSRGS